MEDIFCPICKSKLEVTHQGRYQDRCEHVSQPNREPSLKDGYQCTNLAWCKATVYNFTWISDGEYYINPPDGISYSEASKALKELSTSGLEYALNSWNHHYELGKKAIEARKKVIKIGKYKIDIEPKERGYDYPVETQYQPRRFGWKFQYWKETRDGCYTSITPTYRMVKYYFRQFNQHYRNILHNAEKNKNSIKGAMEIIDCIHWGRPDDRGFARISSFLIRVLYYNRVKKIRRLSKEFAGI
jgi:hypothetical protein